ncbi:NAD-dependent epimerase/dehydratase family protein [Leptospira sp. 2 VSF19]|uniref:NAD-dependent epimerase/dehydratase family protein n=1 Tax=Leptospira soteropolitanensis TaxID=2950025 RepID=A0AAW5VPD5_9LEPT|nr:NAD-dependent epimerase/dehydratase family protein [Leptospira soteropolitanensis]MCW7493179.1 NAD-dependent epimerase/dehydratase family protein [Leptospira soteropolitanensis]MCW7500752.1 NAD-dependent epimerase/dehydratase family protein [Leptospira soteropolitanensis]MCW7523029.1 NAD-dependent epimerase/dehydratase family protein [Leptospira soteropolitanensis]MCW7526864.1 NAD-dependent epimerase/dehydratase family protein [Leptospira soteropolitanensis]MCW7530747.1 NAD-dependent epimer
MKILITGADGFVASNLRIHISQNKNHEILLHNKKTTESELYDFLGRADFIFHLAGVNRPLSENEFNIGNADLTKQIVSHLEDLNKRTPIVFSSSIQALLTNPYGISKKQGEDFILEYSKRTCASVYIYRLPNLFGKFSKPNYNSVVATFCYNVSRSLPIVVNDRDKELNLCFVDDLVASFLDVLENKLVTGFVEVTPIYNVTLGTLADLITSFRDNREKLLIENVGQGFIRALYSTYVSFLPISSCSYSIPKYEDPRGSFVEMLKTKESGQFSFFSALPGVTRGRHYHHTKTEKFLIIRGKALFRFQHLITKEYYELVVTDKEPTIVDTIPGWTHDITNIGENELIVMLWANEVFNRELPDTISAEITK